MSQEKKPVRHSDKDAALNRENERRFEYDLPLVTREERDERVAREMWEKYNYDVNK